MTFYTPSEYFSELRPAGIPIVRGAHILRMSVLVETGTPGLDLRCAARQYAEMETSADTMGLPIEESDDHSPCRCPCGAIKRAEARYSQLALV